MALIPRFMLRHTATVEAYVGETGTGPQYSAGVSVKCFALDKRQMVRGAYEDQVISTTQLFCRPNTAIPLHSRVTVGGRKFTVVDYIVNDGGLWPTPNHLQVFLR